MNTEKPKKKTGPKPEVLINPGSTEDLARTVLKAGKPKWQTVKGDEEASDDE